MKAIRIGVDYPTIVFINNITHITAIDMHCTIHLSSGKEILVFYDVNHLLYLISIADENFKEIFIEQQYAFHDKPKNSSTVLIQNGPLVTVSYSIDNIPSQTIEQ